MQTWQSEFRRLSLALVWGEGCRHYPQELFAAVSIIFNGVVGMVLTEWIPSAAAILMREHRHGEIAALPYDKGRGASWTPFLHQDFAIQTGSHWLLKAIWSDITYVSVARQPLRRCLWSAHLCQSNSYPLCPRLITLIKIKRRRYKELMPRRSQTKQSWLELQSQ